LPRGGDGPGDVGVPDVAEGEIHVLQEINKLADGPLGPLELRLDLVAQAGPELLAIQRRPEDERDLDGGGRRDGTGLGEIPATGCLDAELTLDVQQALDLSGVLRGRLRRGILGRLLPF
jgi:hypothetical protein